MGKMQEKGEQGHDVVSQLHPLHSPKQNRTANMEVKKKKKGRVNSCHNFPLIYSSVIWTYLKS